MPERDNDLEAALAALGSTYEALVFLPGERESLGDLVLGRFHARLRERLLTDLPLPIRSEVEALKRQALGHHGDTQTPLRAA